MYLFLEFRKKLFFLLPILVNLLCQAKSTNIPVILWHGMGDSAQGMIGMKNIIENEMNGTYVRALNIGKTTIEDMASGYFIHPSKQIDFVCNEIKNDEKLSNGYNAIGFSQGGQFLRGLVQRCPQPPMKNLITFGAQHQGIFGLPKCPSLTSNLCAKFRDFLNKGAYLSWIQKSLVQATYWHDPLNEETYRTKNTFLSDINNELNINQSYIQNLQSLHKFIMVKFLNDTMVQPLESQWFEFYYSGQSRLIEPLRKSKLYLEDNLGLRQMDLDGKLVFLEKEGDHLQIGKEWFIDNIIPYLKN